MSTTRGNATVGVVKEGFKVPLSEQFDGQQDKLNVFLIKCELYIEVYSKELTTNFDKIL